jgi:acyl-CoA thioesterase-1
MRLACIAVVTLALAGCGSTDAEHPSPGTQHSGTQHSAPSTQHPAPSTQHSAPEAPDRRPKIVILGDSLTAGLGLPVAQAYPSRLQEKLDAAGLPFQIVNAGVSGDTSAGGLSRLDWSLQGDVKILVVALGGNDALRALPVEQLSDNLARIIETAQKRGIKVILAGMEAPTNWGRDYDVSFHRVYPTLAARYRVPLVPFLLQGVAGSDALNQADGIHPTAAGARIVADNVWKALKPVAEQLQPS